jgi:integrase
VTAHDLLRIGPTLHRNREPLKGSPGAWVAAFELRNVTNWIAPITAADRRIQTPTAPLDCEEPIGCGAARSEARTRAARRRSVRRDFRQALAVVPDLQPKEWTPRELRHSFVSVLSDAGIPVEEISQLVGHRGTTVTELVYRHQLRPVIQTGATVMDRLFERGSDA